MNKNSSVKKKIVLPVVLGILCSIVIVVTCLVIMFTVNITSISQDYSTALTEKYAMETKSILDQALTKADSLASAISVSAVTKNITRENILSLVSDTLKTNPNVVGIGVGMEPNALDGKDAQNIGEDHSDNTGRFVPYTARSGNDTAYTLLVGYDDLGADGSWYHIPKSTKKNYVTAPYWYEIGNEKVLITTCVAPILSSNGDFLGMVGFDIEVATIGHVAENAKIFDSGTIMLLAPDKTIAHSPNEEIEGKPIEQLFGKELLDTVNTVYTTKQTNYVQTKHKLLKKNVIDTLVPISISENEATWIVQSTIPVMEIYAPARTALIMTISFLLLSVLAIYILVNKIVKKVLTPLNYLNDITNAITTTGDLSINIDTLNAPNDEIGQTLYSVSSIVQLMNEWQKSLESVAEGDLTTTVTIRSDRDVFALKLEDMIDKNHTMISNISSSINQIANSSEQLSSGAQELSQGAANQASSVEILSKTIVGIESQVNSNATNAANASGKASTVGIHVDQSNHYMTEMIEAMGQIENKSGEISKIIKAIEDIAFQTNILALNAAVEAARAGAAGKGFAVVADEVRNLASKSSAAAKNTTILIEDTVQAVKNGVIIANNTAKSLNQTVAITNEAVTLIDQIAYENKEQAKSLSEITYSVEQITSVVQTNSATAEQSAAASEELSSQASLLKEQISKYKLKNDKGELIYSNYQIPNHLIEKR